MTDKLLSVKEIKEDIDKVKKELHPVHLVRMKEIGLCEDVSYVLYMKTSLELLNQSLALAEKIEQLQAENDKLKEERAKLKDYLSKEGYQLEVIVENFDTRLTRPSDWEELNILNPPPNTKEKSE